MYSPNLNWSHEYASTMLFRHMNSVNNLNIDKESEDFICDLIVGNKAPYEQSPSKLQPFIYKIFFRGLDV